MAAKNQESQPMETEPSPDHDEDLIEEEIQVEDDLDYVDI